MGLLTALVSPRFAEAKPKAGPVGSGKYQSLEETLVAAGWTMTPERSASYTVGDIYSRTTNTPVAFKDDCFDAEPRENAYTSLEVVQAMRAGSRVPLGVARFKAEGMEYKQLKFAEPYMTELADMHLRPNENCKQFLAGRTDLADLFVIKAVLSAEVKEQLCRSIDGSAGALGFGASAGAQQECVQASEGHVAVAYKTQPAASLVKVVAAQVTQSAGAAAPQSATSPAQATSSVDFGAGAGGLGVAERLREQRCVDAAKELGAAARESRISTAETEVENRARSAWSGQAKELESCVKLRREQRGDCISAVKKWLSLARSMPVTIPAGVETVDTECGSRQLAFEQVTRTVVASGVSKAESLLARLKAQNVVTNTTTGTASGVRPKNLRTSPRPSIDGSGHSDGGGETIGFTAETLAELKIADEAWVQRDDEAQLRLALEKYEAVYNREPKYRPALIRLVRGWFWLGDVRVEKKKDRLKAWATAITWGTRCMKVNTGFARLKKLTWERDPTIPQAAIQVMGAEDVPCLYWTAMARGEWAKLKGLSMKLKFRADDKALITKVDELDHRYFYAATDRYWGAHYAALPSFAGGDLAKSKGHFEKSLAAGPEYLETKLLYAQYYATKSANNALFERLLQEVIDADAGMIPTIAPENRAVQDKAAIMLRNKSDYF